MGFFFETAHEKLPQGGARDKKKEKVTGPRRSSLVFRNSKLITDSLSRYNDFFNLGAGLKPTVLLALICISAPVCGFRPFLALRFLTKKVPKPG